MAALKRKEKLDEVEVDPDYRVVLRSSTIFVSPWAGVESVLILGFDGFGCSVPSYGQQQGSRCLARGDACEEMHSGSPEDAYIVEELLIFGTLASPQALD